MTGDGYKSMLAAGGPTALGFIQTFAHPENPSWSVPASDAVTGFDFQWGRLLSSPATGTYVLSYDQLQNWTPKLGLPTTDIYTSPHGDSVQDFQNGRISVTISEDVTVTFGTQLPRRSEPTVLARSRPGIYSGAAFSCLRVVGSHPRLRTVRSALLGGIVAKHAAGALMLLIALILTGCGGTQPAAETSASSSQPGVMPNLRGKKAGEALSELANAKINYQVIGSDGVAFSDSTPPADAIVSDQDKAPDDDVEFGTIVTLTVQATTTGGTAAALAAQAEATKDKAAKDAADYAHGKRYTYECFKDPSDPTTASPVTYSYRDLWKLRAYKTFTVCSVQIAGGNPREVTLMPAEKTVVARLGKEGGDISSPGMAYADILRTCAVLGDDWDSPPDVDAQRATATEALKMCPDTPNAAKMRQKATAGADVTLVDGTYVVGKDAPAGSYQVQVAAGDNGVHGCYWARSTPTGDIIANQFIDFAPHGATVTIKAGEGFKSQGCGTWKKVG